MGEDQRRWAGPAEVGAIMWRKAGRAGGNGGGERAGSGWRRQFAALGARGSWAPVGAVLWAWPCRLPEGSAAGVGAVLLPPAAAAGGTTRPAVGSVLPRLAEGGGRGATCHAGIVRTGIGQWR